MNMLPFFEWCAATSFGQAISTSTWAFAVIESVHLLALSVIGGAVLIVDLRLLGFGLRRQSLAQVARDARPWFVGSLIVMLVTGIALFMSEPVKCYYSTPFWVKMTSLRAVDRLRVHGALEDDAGRRDASATGVVQAGRTRLAGAVVRRRRGRAVDRLLGIRTRNAESAESAEIHSANSANSRLTLLLVFVASFASFSRAPRRMLPIA